MYYIQTTIQRKTIERNCFSLVAEISLIQDDHNTDWNTVLLTTPHPSFCNVANLPQKTIKLAQTLPSFIYLSNIDSLSDEILKTNSYYRGFPCAHDHVIRNTQSHWCYHCATKIRDNICGFDVNYMNGNYKHKYADLWSKIPVGHLEDCWDAPKLTKKRLCMPSYRSAYASQNSANVNVHKAVYQSAWGDIGSMFVTRVCGNSACLNPLHLISSWNRTFPPGTISPFDYEFKPEKLMQFAHLRKTKDLQKLREHKYKQTIQNPLAHQNCPDYDEEYRQYYKIECPEQL
jgi:hypothetical protein